MKNSLIWLLLFTGINGFGMECLDSKESNDQSIQEDIKEVKNEQETTPLHTRALTKKQQFEVDLSEAFSILDKHCPEWRRDLLYGRRDDKYNWRHNYN